MSSPVSPTFNLDVRARRGEGFVVGGVLTALTAVILLQSQQTAQFLVFSICAFTSVTLGFAQLGWIGGPRRIIRVVWQDDGRWVITDTSGKTRELELSPACRVAPHLIWLQWSGKGVRRLLLLPGDLPNNDFRRLVVRLRLAGQPSAEKTDHGS